MSKLRINDLESLDTGALVEVDAIANGQTGLSRRVIYVDDLAGLKALPAGGLAGGQAGKVASTGRAGDFIWVASDQSSNVTNDPQEGVWVSPDSDSTGASGAWKRQYSGRARVEWFGVDGGDSTAAFKAAVEYAGRVSLSSETQLSSIFLDDSALDVDIAGDSNSARINLVNVSAGGSSYTEYLTGGHLRFNTKRFGLHGIEFDYPGNSGQIDRVWVSAEAEHVDVSGCSFGYGKLAVRGSKSVDVRKNNFINTTGGTVKTNNALLWTTISDVEASHLVKDNVFQNINIDGSNQDTYKCSNADLPDQHPFLINNNFVNKATNALAQVDIYVGGQRAKIHGNTFINTQFHRKNNEVNAVIPDVAGTDLAGNTFVFTDGFYNASNDATAAVYFSGGRGMIRDNNFFVDTYLREAVIFLERGVESDPAQDQDFMQITGNSVYARNAIEGTDETERFILLGSQASFNGDIVLSNNIVDGLKRYALLGVSSRSTIANDRWINAAPIGTTITCGSLLGFFCDQEFTFEARRVSNVFNGGKTIDYVASASSLSTSFKSIVFVDDATTTIDSLTDCTSGQPVTIVNYDSATLSFNFPGLSFSLAQYEAATVIPFRLSGGTTLRYAKVT